MTNVRNKVAYVTRESQTRDHECHWPGCKVQVSPALWGCRTHWFRLPREFRLRIWATYRPGQEKDGNPSEAYLEVASEAQAWISKHVAELKERQP